MINLDICNQCKNKCHVVEYMTFMFSEGIEVILTNKRTGLKETYDNLEALAKKVKLPEDCSFRLEQVMIEGTNK